MQALSNTVLLRSYYWSDEFQKDTSKTPLSMDGRLASGFADLIKAMWKNDHTVLPPVDLKRLIAERRPEFAGYQQHDAQEVLTFLLDGLHEDVNHAPYPRPIVEDPSTAGKDDATVALEAWEGNLRRNRSRIVDLFQFQVRSEITFPDIGDRSLKFDPMMYLTLPLPKPPHTVKLTVVPLGYPAVAPTKCIIEIPKEKQFSDLEAKLSQDLPIDPGFLLAAPRCFVFCNLFNHRILKMWESTQPIGDIRSTYDDVWAFEVAQQRQPLPVEAIEQQSNIHTSTGWANEGEQSKTEISVSDPPVPALEYVSVYVRRRNGSEQFVQFAPPFVFAVRSGTTLCTELAERAMSSADRLKTFFGNSELQVSLTATELFGAGEGVGFNTDGIYQANPRSQLNLNFLDLDPPYSAINPQDDALRPSLPKLPEPEEAAPGSALASASPASTSLTLEQCLERFTREEELAREDWVRCERTKDVERSLKKMDIWSAPDYLIVHLKRFGSDVLTGPVEKIETLVKAPMDFDLSPWIRGSIPKGGAQYKLYAAVNHSGSLSFGHYTAHARVGSGADRPWYYFNDATVTPANESDVISKAAYILFYERITDHESVSKFGV
jgi:ubiquitin carboxyl-terminal hydrolase 4/11/15